MQKADIIIKKQPHIGNAVFEHGHPFNTHAKGKARALFWVIAGHG